MCRRTSNEAASGPSVSSVVSRAARLYPILREVRLRHFARSKVVRRRVRTLLLEADRACPALLDEPPLGTVAVVAALPWLRPPSTWSGGGLTGLLRHLLVADGVMVPRSLFFRPPCDSRSVWRARGSYTRQLQVLAVLGRGDGLRALHRAGLLPRTVRRPVFRRLVQTSWVGAFDDHVRRCQLAEHGVEGRIVREWNAKTRLRAFGTAAEEHAKDRVMGWLGRARPRRGWDPSAGRDLMRAVSRSLRRGEDPTRVDPGRLLALEAERQARRHARYAPTGPLPVLGLPPWSVEVGGVTWSVAELTTGEALAEEGQRMQHCVATYAAKVRAGRCTIFSLRCDGERRLTVELRPSTRAVVQVKGLRNRAADRDEQRMLTRWAGERAVVVGVR